jgi:hypothetical protein
MNNRLGMLVPVLVLGIGLGCTVKDKGLGAGEPMADPVSPGRSPGTGTMPGPTTPPTTNPGNMGMMGTAPADAGSTTPSMPPTMGSPATDALAPTPATDAKAPDPTPTPPTPMPDASAPDTTPTMPPPVSACAAGARPAGNIRRVAEIPRSDEFTFDNDGELIALSGNDVVRIASGRMPQLLFRNVSTLRQGGAMRVLPDGDILIADYSQDRVLRVDLQTGRERGPMQVPSPIKMAIGPGGDLYVTSNQGSIYRVRTASGVVDMAINTRLRLGGITFSRDYKAVYVGAQDERAIYSLQVGAGGTLGAPVLWTPNVSSPQTLTTDECGRIYVAGSDDGRIRRIGASGDAEIVATVQANDIWALAFGSGKHGWSDTSLFALDDNQGNLFEVPMGVKGAPPPPATRP